MAEKDFDSEEFEKKIDILFEGANKVKKEVAAKMFEKTVSRTPLKTGNAISSWQFAVNGSAGYSLISPSFEMYTPQERAHTEGKKFREAVEPLLEGTKLEDSVEIHNSCGYILKIENGGYKGAVYNEDPDPPYYPDPPYTPKFTLTSGGYSKKAPVGMVKITMEEANRIVSEVVAKSK